MSECKSLMKSSMVLQEQWSYRLASHFLDLDLGVERPGPAKESLSPSSEELFSLEDMVEHSAMFEFYGHFFPNSGHSQLEGPGKRLHLIFKVLGQNLWQCRESLRTAPGMKWNKELNPSLLRCFTIETYSNPRNYIFQALFMRMALLRLYHQYQQTVFIQPSITKGSAGRPLIDYFNWLVGGNHGWKAVYLNQLRGNLERGLISSSWSPLCSRRGQNGRRCMKRYIIYNI